MDLLTVLVFPIVWMLTLMVRACLRIPKPPRVLVVVSVNEVRLTERNQKTGQAFDKVWRSDKISECRANQYESGMWVRVIGVEQQTCLRELTVEEVNRISEVIRTALVKLLGDKCMLKSA